ncbi:MAG: glycogen-binding domain-containing protein [Gemmatimonadaceae bacterium]|nr:glycogen-binding domain-containing protein [Gemmatimonadaceae bacterium]
MTTRRRSLQVAVLTASLPTLVAAQVNVDVSTGELRFRGQPTNSALTIAPQLSGQSAGLRVWGAGQFALADNGSTRSSLQAMLTTRRSFAFGLRPTFSARGQDDPLASDVRNRRVDGALGVSVGSVSFGANATVGLARSVHGNTNRSVQTSSATVHLARGAFQWRVGYAGNAFDAPAAMPNAQSGFSLSRTRLSDVSSDASWRYRGFEIGGFVGRRLGGHEEDGRNWGGGFATLALNDRVAIVARQETAPSDPTRHLAAQRISTIGFRIRPTLSRARFEDGSDAAQFRREFQLTRVQGDQHGIRVYVPDATTVELAGSFNDWTPTAMRRIGRGWWELVMPLTAGLHSLNVRTDGGTWGVPPGLESVADEFNGTVGVLLIP